ncbi:MAG TPA: metallophosphoesterase [Frankiaceae bacterium]|nr:metallophosphoesterase [Frankiaceae bacterium]
MDVGTPPERSRAAAILYHLRPATLVAAPGAFALRWLLRLGLPVAAAAAVLRTFPYRATLSGVPFRVQGTLFSRSYISADTTLGSWVFPHVTGLPIGVHITPEDINLLQLARDASGDTPSYVAGLRSEFVDQLPRIGAFLAGEIVLGFLLGLGLAAAINMSIRYLRGLPRRTGELRLRLRQMTGALLVLLAIAAYGGVTYNPRWTRQSRLTGTLAAAQLFPDQLSEYYSRQSKALDVVNAVLGIQGALQDQFQRTTAPPTAFPIMFISDVHLAAAYPLVRRYAENYGVKLIVNTGDESEFGKRQELTNAYLAEISALTRSIPMLWLAGNHDSPAIVSAMRRVPGVTVLGGKTTGQGGSVDVTATSVDAFGLTIAGLPDPRVYGGPGAYGSDDSARVDPLERSAVDAAIRGISQRFDVFATHEPVAADRLASELGDQVRQTNSGHTHEQNAAGDIQNDRHINLVEGSTGAGGLDNIGRSGARPPIEFSIESVAVDCQFTRIQRFSITSSNLSAPANSQQFGNDVTASTLYFRPQNVAPARSCGTEAGISASTPLTPPPTGQAAAGGATPTPPLPRMPP